jgi:predicted DNA-binding helix-hairpin-helix protein
MAAIISKPDTHQKLKILSEDAQYDLACACGTNKDDRRHRGTDGKWIYPITLPSGGKSVLFKTLVSNVCENDCKYCPLRSEIDVRRTSLGVEETARAFMEHLRQKKVFGLFLSSGVCGCADRTMAQLNGIAKVLRRNYAYKGFIHLKIIPAASDAAIEEAVSLASAVSLNIETPGEENMKKLSSKKDFIKDIVRPIKLISRLTAKGNRYSRVKQTTQFIVGAAGEKDSEIVRYMNGLYKKLNLDRIYFSAYQRGLGKSGLPGEETNASPEEVFTREHRLYQADFLMRKYGFENEDIIYDQDGRLSLTDDPKQVWADRHPGFFPVNINKAEKNDLLKIPGLGPITVNRILKRRRESRLYRIDEVGKLNVRLKKALKYLTF